MVLMVILAVLLAGTALMLLMRAAVLPRIRYSENLGRIAAYGFSGGEAAAAEPPARAPMFSELATRLGRLLTRETPGKREEELRKIILSAGLWETKPATVLGYRLLATGLLGGIILWAGATSGWSPIVVVIATAYGAGLGWIGPMFLLKGRARRRTERIELELPELIDLLVVTLEAGIGFNSAMQRSAERMTGPLGDEIRLTLREHNLGLGMNQALGNLLDRCDVPSIRAFVRSIVQSEALGVSIGQVMRDLAGDMRKRRRQIIEEKAQKAPIKMLFPLAFMILPSLLLIMLFPGLYSLVQTLSGT
jgi:tight adherence protein C